MSQLLNRVAQSISQRDSGVLGEDDFQSESLNELWNALEEHNPEFGEAVTLLVRQRELGVEHFQTIALLTQRAMREDLTTPLGVASALHKVRDALIGHVHRAIEGRGKREAAARLVANLPPEWCTSDFLNFAATVKLAPAARLRVDRDLIPMAIHHEGPARAFDALVEPHLDRQHSAAVDLLVAAYLNPNLPSHTYPKIRAGLLRRSRYGSTASIVALAVRLSIECRDEDAADLARALAARNDLQPHHPPVLGLIIWIAGYRDGAVQLSDLQASRTDELGWWTQAARSLQSFIRASSGEPHTVIELLAYSEHTEYPDKSIATVGAMVARLALMRMRAYLAMEHWGQAGREARAVLAYHGYRGYELHVQVPDFEFEGELVARLAVTPDELLEAREVAERLATHPERDTPKLSEGVLFPSLTYSFTTT